MNVLIDCGTPDNKLVNTGARIANDCLLITPAKVVAELCQLSA